MNDYEPSAYKVVPSFVLIIVDFTELATVKFC